MQHLLIRDVKKSLWLIAGKISHLSLLKQQLFLITNQTSSAQSCLKLQMFYASSDFFFSKTGEHRRKQWQEIYNWGNQVT